MSTLSVNSNKLRRHRSILLLRNQKGFAMAVIMALLPILISAVLATFGVITFTQTDLRLKYICRRENIQTQERAAKLLKSLLTMNPEASYLQKRLKTAVAACGYTGAGCAELTRVRATIVLFKIRQQQLISQANIILQQGYYRALTHISREGRDVVNSVPLFKGQFNLTPGSGPLLAVRPEATAEPPTYSPVENFSDRQALEHHWQYRLTTSQPLNIFLDQSFHFDKGCSVTLKQDGDEWVTQIKKAKSLSKWL